MEFKKKPIRPKTHVTPVSPTKPPQKISGEVTDATKKTVDIHIDYGRIAQLGAGLKEQLIHPTWRSAAGLLVACVVIVVVASVLYAQFGHKQPTATPIVKDTSYQTLLPRGKKIDQLGGWKRVSPPNATPVFAYSDSIDGVAVSVSQQPLPEQFLENTGGQLDALAKSYNATTQLPITGGQLYVGSSAKGPQSVMLIKNGLLIFIKSQQKISDESWKRYAESLA